MAWDKLNIYGVGWFRQRDYLAQTSRDACSVAFRTHVTWLDIVQSDPYGDLNLNQKRATYRPGEVWIETLGGRTERLAAPEVTDALLWRLARQIASVTHQGVSREHPLLAARLPDGARVQIVAPPATRGPMAVAIRKPVSAEFSLADYASRGAFVRTSRADGDPRSEARLRRLYKAGDWEGFLRAAVRARKTIVVAGGTSTGKTTFLNALLKEVDPTERLILIEDTPELLLRHENAIGSWPSAATGARPE